MFNWKAENQILLDEQVGGKGRRFETRFLQAGLVKYSFGVCLLDKEVIDKFIYNFVGCPVIINHKDVTNESAKDDRVGVISRIWFNERDGWYWGEGVIFDQEALDLIDQGYNVSCQYEITEYSSTGGIHNGNNYDKTILNGKPEHLAIVQNPRYENAMIAVNAMEIEEMEETKIEEAENQEEKGETDKNDIIQAINEIKGLDMFKNLFKKKEKQMDKEEMKSIMMECLTELTASNEAEKKDEPDYKKMYEDLKAENEKAKEEAEKKAEEKEDEKEEKEEKVEEAENKCDKAKNSIEEQKEALMSGVVSTKSTYITQAKARELGKELF